MGVWVGGSLGYMDDGQLPNITGGISNYANFGALSNNSALYSGGTASWGAMSASQQTHNENIYFDASRCSSAYSRSDNFVIPRRLNVNYVIKY